MAKFCPLSFMGSWNGLFYYQGSLCDNCTMTMGVDNVPHDPPYTMCQRCGGPANGCPNPIINPGRGKGAPHETGSASESPLASIIVSRTLKKAGLSRVILPSGAGGHQPAKDDFAPQAGFTVSNEYNIFYTAAEGDVRHARLVRVTGFIRTVDNAGNPVNDAAGNAIPAVEVKFLIGQEQATGGAGETDVELYHYEPGFSKKYHQLNRHSSSRSERFHVLLRTPDLDPDQ